MVKLNVPKVKSLMREKGKNPEALAYSAGFSPSVLKGFLRDAAAPMDYAVSIARALDVPIITITTA